VGTTTATACAASREVLERFLAGHWTPRIGDNDRSILTRWLDWGHGHGYDPLGGAGAVALASFIAEQKAARPLSDLPGDSVIGVTHLDAAATP